MTERDEYTQDCREWNEIELCKPVSWIPAFIVMAVFVAVAAGVVLFFV